MPKRVRGVRVFVADDAISKEVFTDVVISPLADEPHISDLLAQELETTAEDFKGFWRFKWKLKEKVKRGERRGWEVGDRA